MKVYIDLRDWWIGYYRGDTHHYVCPFPTIVIRWRRAFRVRWTIRAALRLLVWGHATFHEGPKGVPDDRCGICQNNRRDAVSR